MTAVVTLLQWMGVLDYGWLSSFGVSHMILPSFTLMNSAHNSALVAAAVTNFRIAQRGEMTPSSQIG